MKTKKFISILLVIMLACTLIPISVAASDITFTALDGTQSSTELGYAKLFDGKNTTDNCTKWSDSFNADKSSYVVFAASEAVFIDAYTFVTADNASSYPKRTPKSWVLYGCNDYDTTKKSATWREIDSVTDDTTITNKNYTSYRFEIENIRKKYKYYKLCITANGGDELMQLCGLNLSVFDGNVTFSAITGTAGVNSSENYDKLVDGKKTETDGTKWGVNNFSSAYIVIEASNRIALNGYTFTTGNDNATATGRNPKDWTLYGCNDYNTANNSGTWTVIADVTNDTVMKDENYTSYSYDVDSNTKYRYFKLEITANQGDSFMQLGEIEFSWDDIKEEVKTDNVSLTALVGTQNSKISENYDKLVDGTTTTKWCYSVEKSPYIILKTSEPVILDGYIFTTANDTRSYSVRNPKDWTLYGCNDFDEENKSGGTWSVIQSVADDNTMRAENYTPYTFKINDNNRSYTYYKLVITANHGEALMQLSELEFLYEKAYKITFDKNGGDTDAVPNEMYSGLGLPTEPTKDGYLFVGWYTKDGTNGEWGEKITENMRLNNDTTVYARWRIYGSGKAVVFPESGFLDKRRTSIYLGKYPQTYLDCEEEPTTGTENVDWIYKHMPGWSWEHWWFSLDPIKWQVHSTNGKMAYMISAKMLDTMNYSDNDEAVTWYDSKLRSFLNGYSGGFNSSGVDFRETNFKDRAFSGTEYGVIASNPESQKDSHLGGADIYDKIFVPSVDELDEDHGLYPREYRTSEITDYALEGGGTFRIRWDLRAWMLRKNSNETGYYYASYTTGGVYYSDEPGNTEAGCVRPAFNLDYSKIAFATDIKVGKEFDGLTAVGLSDNNEYKLTALDGAKVMTAEYKSRNGNVIEFEYSNADSGNNEYLSAIVKNNGEVRYYGRLKNIADEDAENGTYSLTLPSDYDYFTGDRLYVFNEQINGTYELDLASGLSEIDIMTEVPLITFDKNGGDTEVEPQSIYLGGGLPTTKPTKIGYKFVGYYTQDGTNGEWGTEFTAETQVEENITVYAKYEMLTVTFDTNGGDTETTSRIYSDGLPETDPTRLGYVFEGWYTMNGKNNNWGTKVTQNPQFTDDTTVYAKWTAINYDNAQNVTFQILSGTAGGTNQSYDKLTDGKNTTKWCVGNFSGAEVVLKASEYVVVDGYTFTTANDNETYKGRNPKSWTIYGCNDYNETDKTGSWKVLNTVTDDTVMQDKNYTDYSYEFDNSSAYLYYKLEITQIQSGSVMQISEFKFNCKSCEHSWNEPTEQKATCTDFTYDVYTCLKCGQIKKVITGDKLGHNYDENGYCPRCETFLNVSVNNDNFYNDMQAAIDAAADGDTLALNQDVEITDMLIIDAKKIIFDLNGYTLKMTGTTRIMEIHSNAELTLIDSSDKKTGTLTGGNGVREGGAVYNSGTFVMNGGKITDCTAIFNGGGVYNAGKFTMNNGTFIENTAGKGGAVYTTGTFIMNDGLITRCIISDVCGGGVCIWSGTMEMNGGTISYNTSRYNGGGIAFMSSARFTMNGGIIEHNVAEVSELSVGGGGGGIYSIAGGVIVINNGIIRDNVSNFKGGGLSVTNGNLRLNNTSIINNYGGKGGGIYITGTTADIDNCVISGNTAPYNREAGGILADNSSTVNIKNTELKNNSAYSNGGAMAIYNATVNLLKNVTISQNNAGSNGGALWLQSATLNITDVAIEDCTAKGDGNAVYISNDTSVVNANGGKIKGTVYNIGTITADAGKASGIYGDVTNTGTISGGIYYGTVSGDGTIDGNKIIFMNDTTQYAVGVVKNGTVAVEPDEPTFDGYMFGGWFIGENGYDFAKSVTSDITLVSKQLALGANGVSVTPNKVYVVSDKTASKVYIGVYKNNKLVNAWTADVAENKTINISDTKLDVSNADKLSAFLWDGNMRPLCKKSVTSLK